MKQIYRLLVVLTLIFLFTPASFSQELTLYVFPAPIDRNWDSPHTLLSTTLINKVLPAIYKKHPIGHVIIRLANDEENTLAGSSYAKDSKINSKILKEGYGLGILFAPIKGKLEKSEDLSTELAAKYSTGKVSFLRFKISNKTYDRLKTYLEEYEARGYCKIYNGNNKPRSGEGAGCTAFAISFLEVAGILRPEWEEIWQEKVKIPMSLIGKPITENKVGFLKAFFTYRWAKDSEDHLYTEFYDPNYMHNWIKKKWKKIKGSTGGDIVAKKENKAIGLEFDVQKVPCPEEAIFKVSDEKAIIGVQ